MSEYFVFADQRRCGDLRQHESGIQPGAGREKRRQAFVQRRIHHALQPPLRNSRQRAQRDAQKIQRKSQRLAMKISARNDLAAVLVCRSRPRLWIFDKHQRIVHR